MRALTSAALAAVLTFGLASAGDAQDAPQESEGYIAMQDGIGLRYTLVKPAGDGPFPTVLQYSGYNPGNDVYDGTFGNMVDEVLDAGIAVIGVNLRGSGCSEGTFHPFTTQWAEDGVAVIDWIGAQPWSDGNVAMAGVSYPAIVGLATAVEQPDGLRAVVATVPLTDLYRDVGYPGGIFNTTFASAWTFLQKYGNLFALQEVAEGDARCAAAMAGQNDPTDITGVQAARHPFVDSLDRYTTFLTPEDLARIEVPTLAYTAWQDEQLGSRATYGYEFLDPSLRWIVGSNGDHITFAGSEWYQDLVLDFLVHFLRDEPDGEFDRPRVQIAHEVRTDGTFDELDTYDTFPVPTRTTTLYAHGDATLRTERTDETGSLDYRYAQPAPSVPVGIDIGTGIHPSFYDESYKAPIPPGGAVAFTTPPLAEDLEIMGPGSLDVWLSSTAQDVDLQVTLTEVRPDGNELYVQRGWLRASHRKLDASRSRPTRPWQTHLEADAAPLGDGPTPLRVELWPVNHVLRAGSALRVYLEAPVGFTGFRQLDVEPGPAVNTVHVAPQTPTRFVFGRTFEVRVTGDHAPCDTLLNQPCRPNPTPVPAGRLSLPDDERAGDHEPSSSSESGVGSANPGSGPLPATGGGQAAVGGLGLALAAVAAATGRRFSRRPAR